MKLYDNGFTDDFKQVDMGEGGNYRKGTEQGGKSPQVEIGQVGPVKRHEDAGRKHSGYGNAEYRLFFGKGRGRDKQIFF